MGSDTADLPDRILESLEEKPRSISEIARELDVEKYAVSKKIEVLEDQGRIETYRVGRSTACILNEDKDSLGTEQGDDAGTDKPAEPEQDDETERASELGDDAQDAPEAEERGESGPITKVPEDDAPDSDPFDDWENDSPDDDVPERNPFEDEGLQEPARPHSNSLSDTNEQSSRPQRSHTPPQTAQRAMDATNAATNAAAQADARTGTGVPSGSSPGDAQVKRSVQDAVQAADHGATQGSGPRTIGIVSGKGGVGKTVVTLNLGAALMDMGENVIVMDADAEMPNVGLQLGMYTYPTSLRQIVAQDMHIMSAMHVDKDSGLRVIPTSLSAEYRQEDVSAAINMIPDDYIVLIDSPPGLDRPVERVIEACDELIFVTTPEIPAVTDTYKLYKAARERGKTVLGAVINQYKSPKKHLSVTEVEKSLELSVLGVIPASDTVEKSIFDNQPAVAMNPHAKPSRAFKQVAADLAGNTYEPTFVEKLKGLLP